MLESSSSSESSTSKQIFTICHQPFLELICSGCTGPKNRVSGSSGCFISNSSKSKDGSDRLLPCGIGFVG